MQRRSCHYAAGPRSRQRLSRSFDAARNCALTMRQLVWERSQISPHPPGRFTRGRDRAANPTRPTLRRPSVTRISRIHMIDVSISMRQ
jgi:hypothetical protein